MSFYQKPYSCIVGGIFTWYEYYLLWPCKKFYINTTARMLLYCKYETLLLTFIVPLCLHVSNIYCLFCHSKAHCELILFCLCVLCSMHVQIIYKLLSKTAMTSFGKMSFKVFVLWTNYKLCIYICTCIHTMVTKEMECFCIVNMKLCF
jgi:hypothetical protein